jgi:hypothetical protein
MRLLVLPLTVVVAACSGGGSAPPDADEALACMAAGRGDMYTPGLERAGKSGALDFKLMSAAPAPPGFNNNTWTIQVNSMSAGVVGSPLDGATITVTPFMPDHQHGTAIKAKVQAMPGGQYQLSPINLWMPGYWETTITVSSTVSSGAVQDSVVYKFCIQA